MRKKKVNERFIFTDVLYLEKSLSMEINDGDVLSEISSIKLKKFSEGKKKIGKNLMQIRHIKIFVIC